MPNDGLRDHDKQQGDLRDDAIDLPEGLKRPRKGPLDKNVGRGEEDITQPLPPPLERNASPPAPSPTRQMLHRPRQLLALPARAVFDLARDLFGHVARPALRGVKCDDADWAVVIAVDQLADHCLAVGAIFVGLAVNAAELTDLFQHDIHFGIETFWNERRCIDC